MITNLIDLCFANIGAYAPYCGIRHGKEWDNTLNILQNHLTLYASRADYEGLPDEFLACTGKNRLWQAMKFFSPAVAWFKHEALGLQCLPVSAMGKIDIAGYPVEWTAFSANGMSFKLNESNSVLMFNDYSFSIPFLKMLYNIELMLECDKTHRQNLRAQRQPLILEMEEDEKSSAQKFVAKLESEDTILVRKLQGEKKNRTAEKYDTHAFESGRSFEGDKLASDYRYFENRNLSMLGFNNENVEKKERLLVDEVNSNNEVVDTFYTTALACEQEAFDKINKMWGYNIKVVPRRLKTFESEVKYDKSSALQSKQTAEKSGNGLE